MKKTENNLDLSREGPDWVHYRRLAVLAHKAGEAALAARYAAHADKLGYEEWAAAHTDFLIERVIPAIDEFTGNPEIKQKRLMVELASDRPTQVVLAAVRTRLLGRSELGDITPAYSSDGEWCGETYSLPLADGTVYQEQYNFQSPNDQNPIVEAVLLRPGLLRPAPGPLTWSL